MRAVIAHNQLAARRFFERFKAAFTTRSNGSTWPKWERTLNHADRYFRGLLRPGRRKSITGLATRMNVDQEQLERFVRESPWEHEQVEEHLRETAPPAVQGPEATLIVDGMGIPKKGDHSVGVARQWCGATGKIDNCQLTVNCTLARPGQDRNADQVTWPLGSRLYLTKKWAGADDADYDDQHERERYARRREEAAIPEAVAYQPKYAIAVDLIEQAIEDDIEHACVVADTNYGMRSTFRERLRELGEPYVLEVETGRPLVIPEDSAIIEPGPTLGGGPPRQYPTYSEEIDPETAADIADQLDEDAWTEVTWNEGTKGNLGGSFYRKRIRVVTDTTNRRVGEETGWLLLQRDHGPADELKVWICWDLDEMTLEELIAWAHLRWTIERFHRDIKQVLGADEFQGRTWRGFHHHMTVVLLTQAFVAEQRLDTGTDGERLDSFEAVARRLVREAAIQRLMDKHGFDRETAEEVGVDMLKGFSEWG